MKAFNENFDSSAGDRLLVQVAKAIETEVRPVDSVVRWQGDEFGVWLVETDAVQGRREAERIREAIRPFGCTVSIGVAEWSPKRDNAQDLVDAADKALCEAKWAGRDRVA